MSRRSLTLAFVGASLLVAGALTGCATGTTSTPDTSAPSGSVEEVEVDAAWLDGGSMAAVMLWGSSTCVPWADEVTYDAGVLSVSLVEPDESTMCTRDLVLRGIPVALPEGIDPTQDLEIEVVGDGYRGDTELEGVAGLVPGTGVEGGQPSAGWGDEDGVFALLTWGSSTCTPQVESVAVPAPGEVAVGFATPPADQVCTADMAPRVTVVSAADVESDTAYEAVLSGDAFDGIRIPIAGTN